MGCVMCNIVDAWFPNNKGNVNAFIAELAYDIARGHPEIVSKINKYVKALKQEEKGVGEQQ